jgi:hypothetical protein
VLTETVGNNLNMKFSFLYYFIVILFFSCNNEKQKKEEVYGIIEEIKLDYVFENAEMCRVSNIYFKGKIYNNSDSIVNIDLKGLESYCNFYKQGDFYMRFRNDTILRNGISIEDFSQSLKSKDSVTFKYRVQLKHLNEYDSLYYGVKHALPNPFENFASLNLNLNDSINIKLDDNLISTYYLDDNEYTDFDKLIFSYKKHRMDQFNRLNNFSDTLNIN